MATLHTPVSGVPVQVYNPPTSGTPHVTLYNEGTSPVYIGGSNVTQTNGLTLRPTHQLSFPLAPFSLYAISGTTATATATTTSGANNSGTTSLSVTSGTGIANGAQIQLGSGTNAEVVTVTAGGGTGTLTVSATQYDHRSGAAVTVMTAAGSTVHTELGL
jgi:hypothetical protein